MRLMQDLKSLLLANDMQFILSKNKQNTKETLQVPSGADASARATVPSIAQLWIKSQVPSSDRQKN